MNKKATKKKEEMKCFEIGPESLEGVAGGADSVDINEMLEKYKDQTECEPYTWTEDDFK